MEIIKNQAAISINNIKMKNNNKVSLPVIQQLLVFNHVPKRVNVKILHKF